LHRSRLFWLLTGTVRRRSKIEDYLLSATHPHGRHKAKFFNKYGFFQDSWEALASALLKHADELEVAGVEDTSFGMRYTLKGRIVAPDGRTPVIHSVWFVEKGESVPRFVTAYPAKRSS